MIDKSSLVGTSTALPYTVREFFEQRAKEQGKTLSAYLRDFLCQIYEYEMAKEKMKILKVERNEDNTKTER